MYINRFTRFYIFRFFFNFKHLLFFILLTVIKKTHVLLKRQTNQSFAYLPVAEYVISLGFHPVYVKYVSNYLHSYTYLHVVFLVAFQAPHFSFFKLFSVHWILQISLYNASSGIFNLSLHSGLYQLCIIISCPSFLLIVV